jgi:hypothetical protein
MKKRRAFHSARAKLFKHRRKETASNSATLIIRIDDKHSAPMPLL